MEQWEVRLPWQTIERLNDDVDQDDQGNQEGDGEQETCRDKLQGFAPTEIAHFVVTRLHTKSRGKDTAHDLPQGQ